MTSLNQRGTNMGTLEPGNTKGTQYERAICDICKGEIPLTKAGVLRIHRQRNHHNYGIPGMFVPACPASRSKLHSGVKRDQ